MEQWTSFRRRMDLHYGISLIAVCSSNLCREGVLVALYDQGIALASFTRANEKWCCVGLNAFGFPTQAM